MPARPSLPTARNRLAQAADIADLRLLAKRRAPRMVFDYVDGAAEAERSLRASVAAFDRVQFHPRVLRDVSEVSLTTELFGRQIAMPLVLGPTGFTRMMHREGEPAVARAAARANLPYTLSTMGTTSPADLAAAAPDGWNWFQLYVVRDRERSSEQLSRARAAGMDVLVLTVDVPVAGARLRDVRHGMTIPPTIRWRSALQAARHPAWWFDFLTGDPLTFATVDDAPGDLAGLINKMFDPSVTLADLEWVRSVWPGRILVKGVQDVRDAKDITSVGAVFLAGGVRSGADIAAAVALGAKAVFVGRAYLLGLTAGGEAGVDRALAILRDEFARTLQLLGVPSVASLTEECVSVLPEGTS